MTRRNNNRRPRSSRGSTNLVDHSIYATGSASGLSITAGELGIPLGRPIRLHQMKVTASHAPDSTGTASGGFQVEVIDSANEIIYLSRLQLAAPGQNTVVTGSVPVGKFDTWASASDVVMRIVGNVTSQCVINTLWQYGNSTIHSSV